MISVIPVPLFIPACAKRRPMNGKKHPSKFDVFPLFLDHTSLNNEIYNQYIMSNPWNNHIPDLRGKALTVEERMYLGMSVIERRITIKQLALRHNLNYKTVATYVRKIRLGQRPQVRCGRPRKLDSIGITNCVDYISHDMTDTNTNLKIRIRLESKLTICRSALRAEVVQMKRISRRTVGRYVDLIRSQITPS